MLPNYEFEEVFMLHRYIGDRKFYKMVLAVAIPIMIQNGITNFVSLLDNIMVGQVGTTQMTGVSIVNTLIFVFNLMLFGASSGIGIFTAQFFGNNDHDGVRHTMRLKLMVCVGLTILGSAVLLYFGEPLVNLYLKGEGDVADIQSSLDYGMTYLRIMVIGFLPFALSQCYSGTLRECGQTVMPMIAGVIAVFVNLILNYILIFGKLGAPAMGVAGAAIATVVSRYVEAAFLIIWTHCNSHKNHFARGLYRSLRVPKVLVVKAVQKGTPLLVNETLWAAGMALMSQCFSLRGYDVVSAFNICNTLTNFFNVAFLTMGSSIGIIVGQMLGANEIERAKDTVRKMIFFSCALSVLVGVLMCCFAWIFPQIYQTTDSIRKLATYMIFCNAPFQLLNAFANASYFTLRSGGKTFITFLFDSVFVCVVSVPVAYVLSRFTTLPILPLYAITQGLDIIKCILGYILVKRGSWIHNIISEEKKEIANA